MPVHAVAQDARFIDRYDVTNAQHWAFAEPAGIGRRSIGDDGGKTPKSREDHPVDHIEGVEAQAREN